MPPETAEKFSGEIANKSLVPLVIATQKVGNASGSVEMRWLSWPTSTQHTFCDRRVGTPFSKLGVSGLVFATVSAGAAQPPNNNVMAIPTHATGETSEDSIAGWIFMGARRARLC